MRKYPAWFRSPRDGEAVNVYVFPGIRNEKSFDLLSMGPDGAPGTDDDIER